MKYFAQLMEDVHGHDKGVAHSVLQTFGYKHKGDSPYYGGQTKTVHSHPHTGSIHTYHDPASNRLTWHHFNSRGRLKRSGEGHESLHSYLRLTHQ